MTHHDPALERAKKHVKAVRDVFYHLMTFVLVNSILIVVDVRSGGEGAVLGLDWAYWVIIGWGFGMAGHAISVFFDDSRVHKEYARQRGGEGGR